MDIVLLEWALAYRTYVGRCANHLPEALASALVKISRIAEGLPNDTAGPYNHCTSLYRQPAVRPRDGQSILPVDFVIAAWEFSGAGFDQVCEFPAREAASGAPISGPAPR
jgi:hypothetical protein